MSKEELKKTLEDMERVQGAINDFTSWFGSPEDGFKETDWPTCEVRFPKYMGTKVASSLHDFRIIKLRDNSVMKEIVREAYETMDKRLKAHEEEYNRLIAEAR